MNHKVALVCTGRPVRNHLCEKGTQVPHQHSSNNLVILCDRHSESLFNASNFIQSIADKCNVSKDDL